MPYKEVLKKPQYMKQKPQIKEQRVVKLSEVERMKRENQVLELEGFMKEKRDQFLKKVDEKFKGKPVWKEVKTQEALERRNQRSEEEVRAK